MSWIERQLDCRLIRSSDLPRLLRQILSFIDVWPAITQDTIQCYESDVDERKYIIRFHFNWDIPAQITEYRIHRPEDILLWFPVNPTIYTVPKVRANRDDFPRDLAHLNPTNPDAPASFCLARESLGSIYARSGIRGILDRLNTWLRDAAAGTLEHDGWEPIPRLHIFSATLDISTFQNFAMSSKSNQPGKALGYALAILDKKNEEDSNYHYRLIAKQKQLMDLWNKAGLDSLKVQRRAIPTGWLSIWGARNQPKHERFWETVMDYDSLMRYAEAAGCKKLAEDAISFFIHHADIFPILNFVLLIGTWRPRPLIDSIPGLASGQAANLEIAEFSILLEKDGSGSPKIKYISELRLLAEPNSRNLNKFAGYSKEPRNTVLMGAGALGAKLAEHIVREGAPSIKIVDKDFFPPHNISRHTLTEESIYFPKSTELKTRLQTINPHCQIDAFQEDITNISAQKLRTNICGNTKGVIIDATADIRVMHRLCQTDGIMRVAKVELAHDGLLGFLYYEGKNRRPRIDDLKAVIPTLGTGIPEIAEWLSTKEENQIETGIGCASASMQISDSRISLHAGHFMASLGTIIRPEYHPQGIGIAILDSRGHFSKWYWIEEKAPEIFNKSTDDLSWEIRIRRKVLDEIDAFRDKNTPIECGGYLYGTYDLCSAHHLYNCRYHSFTKRSEHIPNTTAKCREKC